MRPIDFPDSNCLMKGDHLKTPEGRTVLNLRIYRDDKRMVAKFHLSLRERLSALVFGTVWLFVLGGSWPPVALDARKDVFSKRR